MHPIDDQHSVTDTLADSWPSDRHQLFLHPLHIRRLESCRTECRTSSSLPTPQEAQKQRFSVSSTLTHTQPNYAGSSLRGGP